MKIQTFEKAEALAIVMAGKEEERVPREKNAQEQTDGGREY